MCGVLGQGQKYLSGNLICFRCVVSVAEFGQQSTLSSLSTLALLLQKISDVDRPGLMPCMVVSFFVVVVVCVLFSPIFLLLKW